MVDLHGISYYVNPMHRANFWAYIQLRWKQSCTHAWLGKGGTIHFHWSSCIACSWGPCHSNLRRFAAAVMSISQLQTFIMGICLKMVPFLGLYRDMWGPKKGTMLRHIPILVGSMWVQLTYIWWRFMRKYNMFGCSMPTVLNSIYGFGVWSSCSRATTQARTAQRKGIMAFLKSTVGDSGGDHAIWIRINE